MTEVTLEFISRQIEAVRDEQRRQNEQMRQLDIRAARVENILTGIGERIGHLDALLTAVLAELRAIRTQTSHMMDRITALETS